VVLPNFIVCQVSYPKFIFFLSFSFQNSIKLFRVVNPLLSGEGHQSLEVRKRQGKILTNILLVNVRLCRTFPIIGSTNILNNRTILIGHFPNFLFDNLRKGSDETVDASILFHFSFSLSFFLSYFLYRHYTIDSLDCKRKIPRILSRNFDKTFRNFEYDWHSICYVQLSCQKSWHSICYEDLS